MLGSMGWRRWLGASVAALATATVLWTAPTARSQEVPADPEDVLGIVLDALGLVPDDLPEPLDVLDPVNPACDPLDLGACLLPFPSDHWTVPDATTATGRRVELPLAGMPRNVYGKPIDPTEWNRNDGFSPGATLLTLVPDLDLVATWGLGDRPDRYRDQVTDLGLSLAPEAPIVLVDAATGARHPFFSELDHHEATPAGRRTLIVRPARNLLEGHRYVLGLRRLVDTGGRSIEAGQAFAALRDGLAGGPRQAHFDAAVFPVLEAAGVAREELYLAWDLTIASADNLAGRVLSMRDESFAALGDTDLADGVVQGAAPAYTIDEVEERTDPDDPTARVVRGTITVPNYLTLPAEATLELPDVGSFPAPGARLQYGSPLPGPGDRPVVNPLFPTRAVPFVCSVPRSALDGPPAVPAIYGHGLLGSRSESLGGSTEGLRRHGYLPCAMDWTGMATGDLPNVALILSDLSLFPSLADRAQQGFLEVLHLGRALAHPHGLVEAPAFRGADGEALFDPTGLVYDGNSQGAIMGGALTALGVDFTRAVLGVPGMNYSTLLNRSVDWEGVYAHAAYAFYPSKVDQQIMYALLQMLWDRAEANGYAQHMTTEPLPGTPAKQVLLQAGFGDHQVSNLAAEVEARTIGARRIPTDLPVCRHWAIDPMFGFAANDSAAQEPAVLAYFDSGTPRSPTSNVPPTGFGADPHEHPRRDPGAIEQKVTFFETGRVIDPNAGRHARSYLWPDAAGDRLAEVQADLTGACASTAVPAAPGPTAPEAPIVAPASSDRLPATGASTSPAAPALTVAAGVLLVLLRRTRPPAPVAVHRDRTQGSRTIDG